MKKLFSAILIIVMLLGISTIATAYYENDEYAELKDSTRIFTDVKAKSWFRGAVDYVVTYELMNGVSDTLFDPNSNMTRAMLVTVLWRYEGSPTGFKNNFTDVPSGKWYTNAVAWAGENDIVTGVGAGTFNPNGNITREQLATIMFRYTVYIGSDTGSVGSLSKYADKDKVSKWAQDGMKWAVAYEIISGITDKKTNNIYLDPRGNATRAQVATVLMRYCSNSMFWHEWDEGTKISDPTCTEKGEIQYECVDCGTIKSVAISALGHIRTNEEEVQLPTCTEKGMNRFYCTRCSQNIWEEVKPLGHKWKDATCTAPKTCSRCGAKSGSALGHKYGTGKVTKEATCTKEGIKTYTCTRCGHKHEESIKALGHKWKDATCTSPKTCTRCGAISGNTAAHKYNSKGICTVCGKSKNDVTILLKNTVLPKTFSRYSFSDTLSQKIKVTNFSYESHYYSYSNDVTAYLFFTGTKEYDDEPATSSSCVVSWKLYDSDGYVVDDGRAYTSSVLVGEKFKDAKDYIFDLKPGKTYYLELIDSSW